MAERYWAYVGHCEAEVLRPPLLGCMQALQGLHAPLLHMLPLPLAEHAVYLHCKALCRTMST